LNYSFSGGIATLKNEVKSLGSVDFLDNYPSVRGTLSPTRTAIGQPLFSYYGYQTAGIFQTEGEIENYVSAAGVKLQPYAKPGDLKFVNTNGDDKISNSDKVFLGNPFPDLTYSFNANLAWKGFDLNLFFQGVSGVEIFNAAKFTTMNASQQGYNQLSDIKGAWSPTNTSSSIPRVSAQDLNNNFGNVSDFYVENGAYLRLKNMTLGYTVPASFIKQLSREKIRFYVTGTNLITWTKYTGFDPEVGLDVFGVDNMRYPQARSFVAGLNLTF
jgi:TonB-dependent starch-binding outer membrane protein SusC